MISPKMEFLNCWLGKTTDACCGISMIGLIIYLEKVFYIVDGMFPLCVSRGLGAV